MNLADYLEPLEATPISYGLHKSVSVWGKVVSPATSGYEELLTKGSLAIIGVNETRNSTTKIEGNAPDSIRSFLYSLSGHNIKRPLIDLGNLVQTSSPSQTYSALTDVVAHLQEKGVACIVLGGSQELTYPLYKSIAESTKSINLSIIDSSVDMDDIDDDFSSTCFIGKLANEQRSNLYSINLIGYQSYLTHQRMLTKLQDEHHETIRLGFLRSSIGEVEPYLRDSHLVSLDMSSIRQSDSPGSARPTPNGLYAEEACQLARFAGHSQYSKVFGIFELNPASDTQGHSSHLAAQIVWHYMEAFYQQKPLINIGTGKLKKFYVKSPIPNIQLVFLKDTIYNRWWMELTPHPNEHPKLVACSYNDYLSASNGDVPDRWLRAWKRMT